MEKPVCEHFLEQQNDSNQQQLMALEKQRIRHPEAAVVQLLDGTKSQFRVDRNAYGKDLLNAVISALNVVEKDYFALSYNDFEGNKNWLYSEKRIAKQLKGRSWDFQFEVKFYPPEPSTLSEDLTRFFLFLQVRRDVYTGRLPASFAVHALLGSLIAQSEIGDYESIENSQYVEYLKSAQIAPNSTSELFDKIRELHKLYKGQTPAEAELHYLENVKKLTMYGVNIFQAKDGKGSAVTLGVCAHGLMVYRDQIRVNRFAWPKIIKIAYRRHIFTVKLRPGELEKNETSVAFRLCDYKASKRVWKTAVEHHTFFRLVQPEEKQRKGLLRWGSARFRYDGRTQFQSKMVSQTFDRPAPIVQRSHSARFASRSTDQIVTKHKEPISLLHYVDDGSRDQLSDSPEKSYTMEQEKTLLKSELNITAQEAKVGVGHNWDNIHYEHKTEEMATIPLKSLVNIYHSGCSDDPNKYCPPHQQHLIRQTSFSLLLHKNIELKQSELSLYCDVYHSGRSDYKKKFFPKMICMHESALAVVTDDMRDTMSTVKGIFVNQRPSQEIEMVPLCNVVAVYHSGQSVQAATDNKSSVSDTEIVKINTIQKCDVLSASHENKSSLIIEKRVQCPTNLLLKEKSESLEKMSDLVKVPLQHKVSIYHHGYSSLPIMHDKMGKIMTFSHVRCPSDNEETAEKSINQNAYLKAQTYDDDIGCIKKLQELSQIPLKQTTRVYHGSQDYVKKKLKSPRKCSYSSTSTSSSNSLSSSSKKIKKAKSGTLAFFRFPQKKVISEKSSTVKKSKFIAFLRRKSKSSLDNEVENLGVCQETQRNDVPQKCLCKKVELEYVPLHQLVQIYHSGYSLIPYKKRIIPFQRVIWSGSEEFIEKHQINFENYPQISAVYGGALEQIIKAEDHIQIPIRQEVKLYHKGQSVPNIKQKNPPTVGEIFIKQRISLTSSESNLSSSSANENENIRKNKRPKVPKKDDKTLHRKECDLGKKENKDKMVFENSQTVTKEYSLSSDKYHGPLHDLYHHADLDKVKCTTYHSIHPIKFDEPVARLDLNCELAAKPLHQKVSVYHSGMSVMPTNRKTKKGKVKICQNLRQLSSGSDSEKSAEIRKGCFNSLTKSRYKNLPHKSITCDFLSAEKSSQMPQMLSKYSELDSVPIHCQVHVYHCGYSEMKSRRKKKMLKMNHKQSVYSSSSSSTTSENSSSNTSKPSSEEEHGVSERGQHNTGGGGLFEFLKNENKITKSATSKDKSKKNKRKDKKNVAYNDSSEAEDEWTSGKKQKIQGKLKQQVAVPVINGERHSNNDHREKDVGQNSTICHWQESSEEPQMDFGSLRTEVFGHDSELVNNGIELEREYAGRDDGHIPGEFVSSRTVTSGNRTVETITYKTEKDGVIETHVEHRVTVPGDAIDHDAELNQAIAEATQMNPDMTVEKIEVRQELQS